MSLTAEEDVVAECGDGVGIFQHDCALGIDDVATEHKVLAGKSVDATAVVEFGHGTVNEVPLDSAVPAPIGYGCVGGVVNFVVTDLTVSTASRKRDGAWIGEAHVVYVIVGYQCSVTTESNAACARMVDVTPLDDKVVT